MEFYIGGYFLVQGYDLAALKQNLRDKENENILLPDKIWTVSECLCEIYPDLSVFPSNRNNPPPVRYSYFYSLLNEVKESLFAWGEKLIEKDELGPPNVFLSLTAAKQFYFQFLKDLPEIKLLSIALAEPDLTAYFEENQELRNWGGVYKKLQQHQLIDNNADTRGFDILGNEVNGEFHNFICNCLQVDYRKKLNIDLNQNGLIDNYEDAVRASDYTNLDEVGAEPVFWQPWLVSEYSLSEYEPV